MFPFYFKVGMGLVGSSGTFLLSLQLIEMGCESLVGNSSDSWSSFIVYTVYYTSLFLCVSLQVSRPSGASLVLDYPHLLACKQALLPSMVEVRGGDSRLEFVWKKLAGSGIEQTKGERQRVANRLRQC